MTTKITERDKRLLYILGIALFLIFFMRFVLLPAFENNVTLRNELKTAQETKTSMEREIAKLDSLDRDITDSNKALKESNADFYGLLSNDLLGEQITSLEVKHGLTPVTQMITGAQTAELPAYIASKKGQTEAASSQAPAASSAASSASGVNKEEVLVQPPTADASYVLTAKVTSTVTGDRAQFLALLDDLKANNPAVRVESFNLMDTGYLNKDLTVNNNVQFSYTVYLYMCNKAGE